MSQVIPLAFAYNQVAYAGTGGKACETAEDCNEGFLLPCVSDSGETIPPGVLGCEGEPVQPLAAECRMTDRDLGLFCQEALREIHGWPKRFGRYRIDPVGAVDRLPWIVGIFASVVVIVGLVERIRRRRV